MALWKICWTAFGLLCLAACAGGRDWAAQNGAGRTVFVFSNGWHTDIIVARADLPADRIPEAADFPDARYLMFGWGDRDYYMTPDPGLWATLKAALWPTPSVMHVVGFARAPPEAFPEAEILQLVLNERAFARLVAALDASFARDGPALGPGLYENSLFYAARGRFHLFSTCNTWTARVLDEAGLAVTSFGVITADSVMQQVRAVAESGGEVQASHIIWSRDFAGPGETRHAESGLQLHP